MKQPTSCDADVWANYREMCRVRRIGQSIQDLQSRNVWPYNETEAMVVMADKRVTEAEGD